MKRCPAISLGLTVLLLAAACSRDDAREAREQAEQAASDAAGATKQAASDAADATKRAASNAAAAAGNAAASAKEAVGLSDPVAQCRALAARQAWAEALEPCTKAHAQAPDDLAIEHALQQAQAATKGG